MHIAIPIHSFEPGGVERVALRLASQWQAGGHKVTIVLGRSDGLCRNQAPPLDYRTLPEPLPTARWETIWMILSLYRFLLAERADVLFCPGNTYTIVCVVMRLLLGDRCPPVLVKISNDLDRRDLPRAIRPLYRFWSHVQGLFLDHFVALADPMRPQLIDQLQVAPGKVTVIADPALDGIESARPAPGRRLRGNGNCRFLCVGRLVRQKNHALLIEAFALHAWPGDTLVIAGEGPERGALEYMIQRRGLRDRVILAGHCENVAGLLRRANVFVLSSEYEGVPAVIIEALAAGLPIATTDCCASMNWLVQHGRFGATAPVRDADALGLAMNRARQLAPPRVRMAEFAAKFTLERAATAYIGAMRELAAERNCAQYRDLSSQMRIWLDRGV